MWGGIYLNFSDPDNPGTPLPYDLSAFAGGSLVLRIASEPTLGSVNVKVEWNGGALELPLSTYTPTSDDSGFLTYVVPLADFTGIDLSQITTPFALFSATAPVVVVPDAGPGTPEPYAGTLYLDDVYYVAPTP
jgi:hypothetical protein